MKGILFPISVLLGGMVLLLLFPQAASGGVVEGLRLCGTSLLPALFPFFVLTRFCSSLAVYSAGPRTETLMRRQFGLSGSCLAPLALSFVGGYPVGVSAVCDLYRSGRLTRQDAERCLVICNNSGPAFFIAVLGNGIFGSAAVGLRLYAVHVVTALLCARCFALPDAPNPRVRRLPQERPSIARAFSDAIGGACAASLQISATVILFSVILSLLRLLPFAARITPFLGLLELTSGVMQLSGSPFSLIAAAFYMGWGGLCVHLQAMALWGNLHPRGYLTEKLLHGLLSAIFVPVWQQPGVFSVTAAAALCLLCIIFPSFRKNRGGNLRKSTL